MLFWLLQLCSNFEFSSVMPPALFFLLRVALAVWDFFWFYTNFRMFFSISLKNVIGILIGLSLNL